jgi:hypothetical protein
MSFGFETSDPRWILLQTVLIMVALLAVNWFFYVMGKYQIFSKEVVCVNKKCPYFHGMSDAKRHWLWIREKLKEAMKWDR